MVQFFSKYSLQFTIVFLFMFGVACKQFYEVYDFFKNKTVQQVDKVRDEKELLTWLVQEVKGLKDQLQQITEKLDSLLVSDLDGIKSWIVMLYKQCKKDPSILDSMQMDLLERRYKHYKNEGGNSYIDNLMQELREIYNDKEDKDASV